MPIHGWTILPGVVAAEVFAKSAGIAVLVVCGIVTYRALRRTAAVPSNHSSDAASPQDISNNACVAQVSCANQVAYEEKAAGQEMRRRNRELGALNAIAVVATQTFERDEILKVAVQQLVQLFAASSGCVLLARSADCELESRASIGEDSPRSLPLNGAAQNWWNRLSETGTEVYNFQNAGDMPTEVREALGLERCRSWLLVIMYSQKRPLGGIVLCADIDWALTESDRNLVIAVSRQLATTIEKVRLYEETLRAYEDLRRTQKQLLQSEKMSAMGQLVSGVAHELNNPLTAILGYAQLLEAEVSTERGRDFVGKLYKQAQRTHRIVQNLLSFACQRKPSRTKVNLGQVLEDTLALRDYDFRINHIDVEVSVPESLPPVLADSHQIEQVFLNIVNNAVDAMLERRGAGVLRARVYTDDKNIYAEFHDSGPGIREPKRIFDPFYTTKQVGKGTGLGLSICYGIIKEHGGSIQAFNHDSGGAVFQVALPIAGGAAVPSTSLDSVPASD